jgi:hypothetical protein
VSDYLSRLVARSLGAASVVRPETASLFEPRDTAPQQLLAEVEAERVASLPASLGGRRPPRAVAHDRAVTQADDARPVLPADAPLDPGRPAAVEAPTPAPVPEPIEPAEIVAPPETETTTTILVRAESREPRPGGGAAPESRQAAGRTASSGRAPLATPRAITTASEHDEPPVVHVTIGRVDVRAVQSAPPAPARPRAPEAPAQQTLAEYLRKGARP